MAHQGGVFIYAEPLDPDLAGRPRRLRLHGRDLNGRGAAIVVELPPKDMLDDVIADALENETSSPFIRSRRFEHAEQLLFQRGRQLSAIVDALFSDACDASALPAQCISLTGCPEALELGWETLLPDEYDAPYSMRHPVVRVVHGVTPYLTDSERRGRLNVHVISARQNWLEDIAPRAVTLPMLRLGLAGESIAFMVTSPAYPNNVKSDLLYAPDSTLLEQRTHVLHIDAHGDLLSYETLVSLYGDTRHFFETHSWGRKIAPYEGMKSFSLLNFIDSDGTGTALPVTGEELGLLCRQARIALVVLNACRAASQAAEGGIAADLIRAGVPDVIGFRHKVSPRGASIFVTALYTALARGYGAAQACCFARAELYRNRRRSLGADVYPYPDWASLVHYSAMPLLRSEPAPLAPLSPVVETSVGLPRKLEWGLLKLQEMIYGARVSKSLPKDSPDAMKPAPFVIFGPVGAGAESLTLEALDWLTNTDSELSWGFLFDLRLGLDAALSPHFDVPIEKWSPHKAVDELLLRSGPACACAFINLDLGIDAGYIDEQEHMRIASIIEELIKRGVITLVHIGRDLFSEHRRGFLRFNAQTMNCWPLAIAEIEEWLLDDPGVEPDSEDSVVCRLLSWISSGYVEMAMIARKAASPERREALLNYLVHGEPEISESTEFEVLRAQVCARWARLSDDVDPGSAVPLLAGLASGIFVSEISLVGRPIGDQTFPLVPVQDYADLARFVELLSDNELCMHFTGSGFPDWQRTGVDPYSLLRINPLLRPLTRRRVAADLLAQLDDWTMAWAADKIRYFNNSWNVPEHEQLLAQIQQEHAWALFAVAIRLARGNAWRARELAGVIERAIRIGWWPAELDATVLFGDIEPHNPAGQNDENAERLCQAIEQRDAGRPEEAKAVLLQIVEDVQMKENSVVVTTAHHLLATVFIDQSNFTEAAKHLSIVEEAALDYFVPPYTRAHTAYEQGTVARNDSRSDDAVLRYKKAIEIAREHRLPDVECLSLQELTDMELLHVPMIMDPNASGNHPLAQSAHLLQAQAYLDAAYVAAAGIKTLPAAERGRLTLLGARIFACRSLLKDAQREGEKALALFNESRDWRARSAQNFLFMLRPFVPDDDTND